MDAKALLSLLRDPGRGRRILSALGPDRLQLLLEPLRRLLPRVPDPDMTLNNLERYLSAAPESLSTLLDDGARGLEILLPLLATSQFFATSSPLFGRARSTDLQFRLCYHYRDRPDTPIQARRNGLACSFCRLGRQ